LYSGYNSMDVRTDRWPLEHGTKEGLIVIFSSWWNICILLHIYYYTYNYDDDDDVIFSFKSSLSNRFFGGRSYSFSYKQTHLNHLLYLNTTTQSILRKRKHKYFHTIIEEIHNMCCVCAKYLN